MLNIFILKKGGLNKMKLNSEKIIPNLMSILIMTTIYTAPIIYSVKKEVIKKEIYSHLKKMSENTDKSLIELSSKEFTFDNKTYFFTAYPGFLGTPCSNILMKEYYHKINK